MKIDRAGRYRQRDGGVARAHMRDSEHLCWGLDSDGEWCSWDEDGRNDPEYVSDDDLIAYLGPLEPGDDGFAKEREA